MRLINAELVELEDFSSSVPSYAILSHTWGRERDEISFYDITKGTVAKNNIGQAKLVGCCEQAQKDRISQVWIDTCCIDKTNAVELDEALRSMFRWYKEAKVCYAYLSDVTKGNDRREWVSQFSSSRWFRRGWTLQELLAPRNLSFYDSNWRFLGTKKELSSVIEKATGIPRHFLLGISPLSDASIAQRMSWASRRETKREEDMAYCLIGIFDVMMPMMYGERGRAFLRLQQEIMANTRDDSILAWGLAATGSTQESPRKEISAGALAASPADFANSGDIVARKRGVRSSSGFTIEGGCVVMNRCLRISATGTFFGLLNCGPEHRIDQIVGIPLSSKPFDEYIRPQGHWAAIFGITVPEGPTQPIWIQTDRQELTTTHGYDNWFYLEDAMDVGLTLIEVHPHHRWRKEESLIATTLDSADESVQQIWARFRPEGEGSSDFLILLELEIGKLPVHPQYHVMVCSQATAIGDLAQNSASLRHAALGKHSARDGTLSIYVTIAKRSMGRHEMFVVKLTETKRSPAVTVDATLELEVMGLKTQLEGMIKGREELRVEAETLIEQNEGKVSAAQSAKERLDAIDDQIRRLNREKMALTDGLGAQNRELDTIRTRGTEIQREHVELSKKMVWVQEQLESLEDQVLSKGYGGISWPVIPASDLPIALNEMTCIETGAIPPDTRRSPDLVPDESQRLSVISSYAKYFETGPLVIYSMVVCVLVGLLDGSDLIEVKFYPTRMNGVHIEEHKTLGPNLQFCGELVRQAFTAAQDGMQAFYRRIDVAVGDRGPLGRMAGILNHPVAEFADFEAGMEELQKLVGSCQMDTDSIQGKFEACRYFVLDLEMAADKGRKEVIRKINAQEKGVDDTKKNKRDRLSEDIAGLERALTILEKSVGALQHLGESIEPMADFFTDISIYMSSLKYRRSELMNWIPEAEPEAMPRVEASRDMPLLAVILYLHSQLTTIRDVAELYLQVSEKYFMAKIHQLKDFTSLKDIRQENLISLLGEWEEDARKEIKDLSYAEWTRMKEARNGKLTPPV